MKKKFVLIQSILLLVISVAILAVAAAAWFIPSAGVNPFTVRVTEGLKLEIKFFKITQSLNETTGQLEEHETEVTAGSAATPDQLYPGVSSKFRIWIKNLAAEDCVLRIRLTGVTVESQGGSQPVEIKDLLKVKITLPGDGGVSEKAFDPQGGEFTLAENIAVAASGGEASLPYEYYLDITGSAVFDSVVVIAATGMSFAAM